MRQRNNDDVKNYLSLKRIVIFSLVISIGFHLMYMMAFFYGEFIFVRPEKAMEKRHETPSIGHAQEADTIHFCGADKTSSTTDLPTRPPQNAKHKGFRYGELLIQTLSSFIMLFVLFLYIRKILRINLNRTWKEVCLVIFGSILITFILGLINSYVSSVVYATKYDWFFQSRKARGYMVRDFTVMTIAILVCNLLRELYRRKTVIVENEELKTENIRTRYEALKNQVDPHFIFNSMNTLQSLIEIDKEKAVDYVQQLSSMLRYTMQSKDMVTLAEEMNCVETYCSMMQIRYGDNLKFDFQIDERYNQAKVLPLSVQGLVENAIKHNVISSKQPFVIQIVTTENNQLEISNAIQPKIKEEGGNGIGLANLVERYRLKWNREVEIRDDGKHFKVTIPLI